MEDTNLAEASINTLETLREEFAQKLKKVEEEIADRARVIRKEKEDFLKTLEHKHFWDSNKMEYREFIFFEDAPFFKASFSDLGLGSITFLIKLSALAYKGGKENLKTIHGRFRIVVKNSELMVTDPTQAFIDAEEIFIDLSKDNIPIELIRYARDLFENTLPKTGEK